MNKKYPVIPIIGVSKLEQLNDNLVSSKIKFSDEQLKKLNKAHSSLPED
jgi:aryl-alcohol dehydrogenase-like predicted oxidoreductase